MNNTDEMVLKPCPHCGTEALLHIDDGWHYVRCAIACQSAISKRTSAHPAGEAIKTWNNRVEGNE